MVDTSAFDQPEARGLRLIVGTLRVATAVQCFGAAGLLLLDPGTSEVTELLQAGKRPLPTDPVTFDRITGGLLFASGMFSLTRPCWPVLLPVSLWFLADAAAPLTEVGSWHHFLGPAARTASVLVPIALMVVDLYPAKGKFSLMRFMIGGSACRLAAVFSFGGLGLQWLVDARSGGETLETVQKAAWVIRGQTLTDDSAAYVSLGIGAVCLAGAINIAVTRARGVAAAMVAVGLIVAGASVFLHGPPGTLHFLKRFGPPGAAMVSFFYWTLSIREFAGEMRPKGS